MGMNLALSAIMAAVTTGVHFVGLAVLLRVMNALERQSLSRAAARSVQLFALLGVVLALFVLHWIEITLYAGAFLGVGAFERWEEALYYSASSFTTVGFGDVVLDPQWRLFGALESANGLILIGWSTAFLISVTNRLNALEAAERQDAQS